jgi:hypothetical protein
LRCHPRGRADMRGAVANPGPLVRPPRRQPGLADLGIHHDDSEARLGADRFLEEDQASPRRSSGVRHGRQCRGARRAPSGGFPGTRHLRAGALGLGLIGLALRRDVAFDSFLEGSAPSSAGGGGPSTASPAAVLPPGVRRSMLRRTARSLGKMFATVVIGRTRRRQRKTRS